MLVLPKPYYFYAFAHKNERQNFIKYVNLKALRRYEIFYYRENNILSFVDRTNSTRERLNYFKWPLKNYEKNINLPTLNYGYTKYLV